MYFPENGPKQIQIPIKYQTQQMAFPFLSQLRISIYSTVLAFSDFSPCCFKDMWTSKNSRKNVFKGHFQKIRYVLFAASTVQT